MWFYRRIQIYLEKIINPNLRIVSPPFETFRKEGWLGYNITFVQKGLSRPGWLDLDFTVLRFESRFVFQDPEQILDEISKKFNNHPGPE